MANSITSELVLKLQDDLTEPAGKAASALRNIEKEEARLAERSKTLEAATRQLSSLGRLDARLERTKERLAAEEAAVKRLSDAMMKVDKPSKKMVEAMMKAEATVKLTTEAIDQQQRKIDKAGAAFEKLAGSPFSSLASAEARLRGEIEGTTAAIRRQAEVSTETRDTEARNMRRREAMAHSFKETMSTLGMLGGPETLHLTHEAAKAGADVQHTRVEMARAGMSPDTIAATEAQAYKLSAQVRTISPAEIMDLAKEARSVLTDQKDLAKVLPTLAKAKSVLDARDPGGEQTQSLGMLVKGAENIGAAKDPERLNKLIDGAVKAMQVMGKTIDAEQFYAFLKNSRLAGAQLSDRFIMTTGMSLLQEMGGQTAGKAVNEIQSELIGGLEHRNVAVRALKKLKLIDPRDVAYSKTGEVTGVKRGKLHVVHGDEKLAHDPDKWVYEDLLPAMRAQGITKVEDQLAMSRQIFSGSKTAQDLVGKLITQQESYAAHAAMYPQAAGVEGYKQNADDPLAAMKGLTTQFEAFASALTSPMMKDAGNVLDSLAGGLGAMANELHEFADKNPHMAAALGAGALGAGAFAGGKLTYGLFGKMFGGSAELKGSAAALTTSANAGLKAAEMLMVAAERLGAPKATPPSTGTATAGEKGAPAAGEAAEHGAAAEAPPKPTGAFGAGGLKGALKGVPKAVIGAGPEALAEYYGYKYATEGIDGGLDALPLKKNSEATQNHLGERGVTGTLSDLWYHLRGQDTPEEAAAKKAAAPPIAGARAAGGPVASGKTYLVGERGPELFTPGASGAISTAEARRMLSRGLSFADGPGETAGAPRTILAALKTLDDHVVLGFTDVARTIGQLGGTLGGGRSARTPSGGAHRLAGARALGGPVGSGETYLVGERGPELFTAGSSGQITSHDRLMGALGDSATLSTADVQRVLASAGRSRMDAETAKAVRDFGFDLTRAVDRVADAVDRADGRALWNRPDDGGYGGDVGGGGGATPSVQGGGGRGAGGSTGSGGGDGKPDGASPATPSTPQARAGITDRPVESGTDAFTLHGPKTRGEGIRPIDPNGFSGTMPSKAGDPAPIVGGPGFNTRGVRNMNPGNIGWGKWAKAHGATGGEGADSGHLVAVFPSFAAGYKAMNDLALSKYGGGMRTLDQLIAGPHGWTPGNHKAAANVAASMGIGPNDDARLDNPAMMEKFKRGLSAQELGPNGGKYALAKVAQESPGSFKVAGAFGLSGFNVPETGKAPDGASPAATGVPGTTQQLRAHALELAASNLGLRASTDPAALKSYMASGGKRYGVDPRYVAWCAAYVGASLEKAGLHASGSLMARSYKNWGEGVRASDAQAGDVMMEGRDLHHVGFATGQKRMQNGQLQVEMLSGNYSHMVRKSWMPASNMTVRRATDKEVEHGDGSAVFPRAAAPSRDGRDGVEGPSARIAPTVDTKHLEHAAGLLDHIHGRMKDIHQMSASAQQRNGGGGMTRVGMLGAKLRGGFAHSGSSFG